MKRSSDNTIWSRQAVLALGFYFATSGVAASAQTESSSPKPVDAKSAESKPAELETVQAFYLTNFSSQNDLNDVQTMLRNMLPHSRLYAMPTANALVIKATADDMQLAQKLISAFDEYKKVYRLTYTINELENGKRIGSQHFAVVVVSGAKTNLKQGSRVALTSGQKGDPVYEDVGIDIDASVDGYKGGVRAHSRVVQSSVAEEKAGLSMGDPVIRQTTFEGTALLEEGKPLILGSLDVPGTTRHQEIEVVSELIKEH